MRENDWIILVIITISVILIALTVGKKNQEKYNIGIPYADPRMIPEFPTYDHSAHANVWTRYNLESDTDPYSPYLPCYDCGGDENYYHT